MTKPSLKPMLSSLTSAGSKSERGPQHAPAGRCGKFERLDLGAVSHDWNRPQAITPRFPRAEIKAHIALLKARVAELETQAGIGKG